MTKEERIKEVKDLLNKIVTLVGNNKDEFLVEASEAAQEVLKSQDEPKDDYADSEYYDSGCSFDDED